MSVSCEIPLIPLAMADGLASSLDSRTARTSQSSSRMASQAARSDGTLQLTILLPKMSSLQMGQ
eukprot:5151352-Heterocapsa_arctica.AAC.1